MAQVPKKIVVDCGREFDNKLLKNFCKESGIEMAFASPQHHQTTGAVERAIAKFRNKLRKLAENNERTWKKYIPQTTIAMKMSFHCGIETSAFIFRRGCTPIFEIDRKLKTPNKNYKVDELKRKIKQKREEYRKEIVKGKVCRDIQFKIGEKFSLFRKSASKMGNNWHLGYLVTRQVNPDAYEVKKGRKTIRAHKTQLKRANTGGGDVGVGTPNQ